MTTKNEVYTKKVLRHELNLTRSQFSFYLNVLFFEELQKVGYQKEMRILPPSVVDKFKSLWYGTNVNS